nr:type V toxin-antitoxin system endoribonuclease antitoxin GhoS [Escherichia coli]
MEGKNKFNTYVVSFDYPSSYSSVFLRLRSLMYDMNFSSIVADEGNDSNLLIVFYVQIMPDDFVMQLHRF